MLAIGLNRSQRGTAQAGDRLSDFELTLFSGYEYNGQATSEPVVSYAARCCCSTSGPRGGKRASREAAACGRPGAYYGTAEMCSSSASATSIRAGGREYLRKFDITYPERTDVGTRISQMFPHQRRSCDLLRRSRRCPAVSVHVDVPIGGPDPSHIDPLAAIGGRMISVQSCCCSPCSSAWVFPGRAADAGGRSTGTG